MYPLSLVRMKCYLGPPICKRVKSSGMPPPRPTHSSTVSRTKGYSDLLRGSATNRTQDELSNHLDLD